MYDVLAKYYDELVKDLDSTKRWHDFVLKHATGKYLLDIACGSGDLTIALSNSYKVDACDISEEMLEIAVNKSKGLDINYFKNNMIDLKISKNYDIITCFCDSINYILDLDEVKKVFIDVYNMLNNDGTFIFDIHSINRLEEFKDEFFETGEFNDITYEWSIESIDDMLYHNFIFFDKESHREFEQHVQKIYEPNFIKKMLTDIGYNVSIFTDFDLIDIQDGEKYFFVCRKD